MSEEPELYVFDFSDAPGAVEYRERLERAREEARRRYRDHLATAFDLIGVTEAPEKLADVALDALTTWNDVETGERCHCSCHPRLPDSDFHDFGFGCVCSQTREDRRSAVQRCFAEIDAFWSSPEGERFTAARRAEEAELEAWLTAQPGVTIRSHGGLAPEQWRGEVDGHVFYFRERHDEWRIELDLRPSGRFARAFVGTDLGDESSFEERELDEGDVIARGTTAVEGYGNTPVERAEFITATIRMHLARQDCELHGQDLSAIEVLLGRAVAWCPACGSRLAS